MTDDTNEDLNISTDATVGVSYQEGSSPPVIGPGSTVRAGTIIYDDVETGSGFQTGHHALIREHTVCGDNVLVGTQTVIDGRTSVGDNVSMQTGVYVPSETEIGSQVFLGPNATLLNDTYPIRVDDDLQGPTIKDNVSVGANATVLPGITVHEGAFVAAGAVVTEDVPENTLAVGVPATHTDLPQELETYNRI